MENLDPEYGSGKSKKMDPDTKPRKTNSKQGYFKVQYYYLDQELLTLPGTSSEPSL